MKMVEGEEAIVDGDTVEEGMVEESMVEEGTVEEAIVDGDMVEEGAVDESMVEESTVEEGMVEEEDTVEGTVEEGTVDGTVEEGTVDGEEVNVSVEDIAVVERIGTAESILINRKVFSFRLAIKNRWPRVRTFTGMMIIFCEIIQNRVSFQTA